GIIIIDGEKRTTITEKEGLYDNSVHAVISDQNGHYWLTTNQGVFTVSHKNIDDFLARKSDKISFRLFKESDGMTTSECNGGAQPSMAITSDGTILIPTVRGIVSVDPTQLSALPPKPAIYIENVKSGNQELAITNDAQHTGQTATVPITNRNIAITYTSLSFLHQGRIVYKHKLSEVDTSWHNAGMRTTAFYTNLSPGHYTLTLQASYIDYPELSNTTTMQIVVPGYFWEMMWFRVLAGFALLFLAVLIVHLRIEAHKKTAARLQVLVHEKTNELRVKNEELQQAALQDGMTGMLNRRYLFEIEKPKIEAYLQRINRILEDQDRRGDSQPTTIYAAFLIAIDDALSIAENYGHEASDKMVKKIAQLIYNNIRKEDLVIRWSDTKFLVLLKNTEPDFIPIFARKIQNIVAQTPFPLSVTKPNPKITLSIGIVHLPFCPGEPTLVSCEQSLLFADFVAHYAQKQGKGATMMLAPRDTEKLREAISKEKITDLLTAQYVEINHI
ncbi:diguanylate cyclase, partial [bacterium]|nr:diguanylate cyclase [bacterium]